MCKNSQRKKNEGELSSAKCKNSLIKAGAELVQEEGALDGTQRAKTETQA